MSNNDSVFSVLLHSGTTLPRLTEHESSVHTTLNNDCTPTWERGSKWNAQLPPAILRAQVDLSKLLTLTIMSRVLMNTLCRTNQCSSFGDLFRAFWAEFSNLLTNLTNPNTLKISTRQPFAAFCCRDDPVVCMADCMTKRTSRPVALTVLLILWSTQSTSWVWVYKSWELPRDASNENVLFFHNWWCVLAPTLAALSKGD